MTIDTKYIESALRQFLNGDTSIDCDRLHTRSDQRGGLFRLSLENEEKVVAKIWHIRNLKERLKSIARLSNGWREWHMHRLVYHAGIATPKPINFYRFTTQRGSNAEALVMEDIGEVKNSLSFLKDLVTQGDEAAVLSFEDRMIDITVQLIDLNVIDIDHQLNNLAMDSKGRLIRLDFECARKKHRCFRPKSAHVKMIARFITGHIHAVQPDVYRSVSFATRLYKRLDLESGIKIKINKVVDKNLAHQLANMGIDTKVTLPN